MNLPRWLRLGVACLLAGAAIGCAVIPKTAPTSPTQAAQLAPSERLILVTIANPPPALNSRAGSSLRGYDASAPYIPGSGTQALVTALAARYQLREITAWPILPLKMHCVVFEIADGASRDDLLAALAKDDRVLIAQPMQTFGTLTDPALPASSGTSPGAYNDPYFGLQRGFTAIDAGGAQQWSRGAGVLVAIIDTGVDTAHPDLAGRVVAQRNFVDDDAGQFGRDFHGTAIAGVIAAVANNHEGIVGVAPGVQLLALKACWQSAEPGQSAQCNSFTLAQALAIAIESGAQVINLSLGGPSDPLLTALVEHALKRGIVVIGAAPASDRAEGFPVGIAGVIAVDVAGQTSLTPMLHAPGKDILTLTPGGHYDFASGSSLAAAHVSGAAALLLARKVRLNPAMLQDLLIRSTAAGESSETAPINICAALAALRPGDVCTAQVLPNAAVSPAPHLR